FTEELREHSVQCRPFRQTVAVAAMSACDVVVRTQRLADTDRHCLLADVQVSEPRHEGSSVQIIDVLLKEPNHDHASVHMKPMRGFTLGLCFGWIQGGRHFETPDNRSST